MSDPGSWEFWIDRSGTGIVAKRPHGTLIAHKPLSVNAGACRRLPDRRP